MSSFDNPPPPYVANDELKRFPPTEKTQDAMLKGPSSVTTQAGLIEQIEELGKSATQIHNYFKSVKDALDVIDSDERVQSKNWSFLPRWTPLQEDWTNLHSESRDIANEAEAYIKEFTDVIISIIHDVENDGDVKKCREVLAKFVQRAEEGTPRNKSSEQAKYLADSFASLKGSVAEFKEWFGEFSLAEDLKDIEQQLAQNLELINALEEELKQYRQTKEKQFGRVAETMQDCAQLCDKIGRWTDSEVFCKRTAILLFLVPPIAIGLVSVGLGTKVGAAAAEAGLNAGAVEVMDLMEKKIQAYSLKVREDNIALFKQKEALSEQEENLKKLAELMEEQASSLNGICSRLVGLQAVWVAVKHDADLIKNSLDEILGSRSDARKGFKMRTNKIWARNDDLAKALRGYSDIVLLRA